jgi:NADPH:quinone reductase-like Zn-dependent oxidoreductase
LFLLVNLGDWIAEMKDVLLGESTPLLDSVIDSAGGPIAQLVGPVLRPGGRVVLYGMTAAPQAPFTMREVLRNQQLIGQSV